MRFSSKCCLVCMRAATRALGIPLVEVPGVEADDVIASYAVSARAAGMRVFILSSDKDLMQLVDNPDEGGGCVRLYDGMKRRLVGPAEVEDKYHGIGPGRLGDLLALMGTARTTYPACPGSARRPRPRCCSSSGISSRCSRRRPR